MHILPTLLLGAALVAGTPALARVDRAAAGAAKLDKALTGRIAGEPVRCINLRDIRSSTVFDRTAILYEVGGKLYLNRPTSGASSLDDDDILLTNTVGSQLCNLDMVRMIDRGANFPRGFVSLGKFVPYTKVPKS
jgi:hypothetical protein